MTDSPASTSPAAIVNDSSQTVSSEHKSPILRATADQHTQQPNHLIFSNDDSWLEQVESIRALEESDTEKSVRLLALFPTLPAEGQDEIIPELAAMTPDEAYDTLGRLLTNTNSSEEILMVLFTDLLDRPNYTRLPLLLEMAKEPNHPKATEAHEMLTVELGGDWGTDWELWAKKISERLASRPE